MDSEIQAGPMRTHEAPTKECLILAIRAEVTKKSISISYNT
jgi:hypothetical protein